MSYSWLENWAMKSIYITMSIVIGQKLTIQIAQYMVENWRGFHMLFTDGQHGFQFTAKRIVKRPSLGFWESEETCWQLQGNLLFWVLIDIQALWIVGWLELQVTMSNSIQRHETKFLKN